MSQWDTKGLAGQADAFRTLLRRLPGVYAAGPRFDENGTLSEIHVLASLARSPKQVVRDVQSAIFAAYGIEVDHRIVSVAQLPENPFANDEDGLAEEETPAEAPAESVRLAVVGIDSRLSLGEYAAPVRLAYNGQIFAGVARCRDTAIQRDRAPAQATIDAVNAFLGHEAYALLEVKRTHLWSEPVALTALELIADREPRVLIGAALEGVNPPLGIVHSALDALNRSLGRMRRVEEQKA